MILGLFCYNLRGPGVFLGESGTMVLGFSMATLCNVSSQSRGLSPAGRSLVCILIFALPLLELFSSCVRRFTSTYKARKGLVAAVRSIVIADANHIHHKVLAKSGSRLATLGLLCLFHGLFVIPVFIYFW